MGLLRIYANKIKEMNFDRMDLLATKIAKDKHKLVELQSDDVVIFSSRTIPRNEKPVLEVQNKLVEKGIKIIKRI